MAHEKMSDGDLMAAYEKLNQRGKQGSVRWCNYQLELRKRGLIK